MSQGILRTDAIRNFLQQMTPSQSQDLAALYNEGMEVQVNVAQGKGEKVEGVYNGLPWRGFSDGVQTWKPFRIPFKAGTAPHYEDSEIRFDLFEHAEGIGLTGWDWKQQRSLWVAFDFDSIIGHKAGLSDAKLQEVSEKASAIPWVTVRKSTSGKGLHLYVFLKAVRTANHKEHAAVGRAILAKLSKETGFDFEAKVDCAGGNMWVWHRKQTGTDGLTLIKASGTLAEVPDNWRDFLNISPKTCKKRPPFIGSSEAAYLGFDKLLQQHPNIKLDAEHKKLIDFLVSNNHVHWMEEEHGCLVTHTIHLKEAHEKLGLKGIFETTSSHSTPHNCFGFPMANGEWVFRRYGQHIQEHGCWTVDPSGFTRCYFNRMPDFATAAKALGGIETASGKFVFQRQADALNRLGAVLGFSIDFPNAWNNRTARATQAKCDGSVRVDVDNEAQDGENRDWVRNAKSWTRVFHLPDAQKPNLDLQMLDEVLRHAITESGEACELILKVGNLWVEEDMPKVRAALRAQGFAAHTVGAMIGTAINNAWVLANRPFESEYPGGRVWNRDAAQMRFKPSDTELDELAFPSWSKILEHCGAELNNAVGANEWCQRNKIKTGADYLGIWIAHMLRMPTRPLPYLFFYGPQNSGKSVFHEALGLLLTKGRAFADNALTNVQGFNGELAHSVLCVVEETDLGKSGQTAYSRIKNWVTGLHIPIHPKFGKPYSLVNTTHWIQCANDQRFCPIFEGDTRITMAYVPSLTPEELIPKTELLKRLEQEAPDFLKKITTVEIPESEDRLGLPALMTADKRSAANKNRSDLEEFIAEECFIVSGACVSFAEFKTKFRAWLEESQRQEWSDKRIGKELPQPPFAKGRMHKDGKHYIGNLSFDKPCEESKSNVKWVIDEGGYLKAEGEPTV